MRRKLGQHFLKDEKVLAKIAVALELKPEETAIEVGAGHGELTRVAFNACPTAKIIAVEKDPKLARVLQEKFLEAKNVKVIEGDIRSELEPITRRLGAWKIFGNIPYYLTGYLLRLLSELENKPDLCVFTVQKEVAEGMAAEPPRMSRLAASVQFWAKPKILEVVSRNCFHPAPEVDSAVVRLVAHPPPGEGQKYYKMVNVLFRQPRKTILNNLLAEAGRGTREKVMAELQKLGLKPTLRPQNLSLEQIAALVKVLT